jgi:hypothetical protein
MLRRIETLSPREGALMPPEALPLRELRCLNAVYQGCTYSLAPSKAGKGRRGHGENTDPDAVDGFASE